MSQATSADWESVCADCGEVVSKPGGKRDNSGRKPREDGKGRTVPKSIKVSQEVADYLTEHDTGLIEDVIRKTKAFKEWSKSR
jgi:hypothetical protein